MKSLIWICCSIWSLAFSNVSLGQQISGIVLSGEEQAPLPGANVLLVKTTIGTSTDVEGKFTLKGVPAGRFTLMVSYVGYENLTVEIPIEGVSAYRLVLKPDPNFLEEVTVRERRPKKQQWLHHLALFTKYFVGEGEFAAACTITNPEVLHFDKSGNKLSAHATEPVVIENKALGYVIHYYLEYFDFDMAHYRINYDGYPAFKEMAPENEDQKTAWLQAREEAYKGSMMHFMRAFYSKRLVEEGFVLRSIEEEVNLKQEVRQVAAVGDTTVTYPQVFNKKHAEFYTQRYSSIMDTVNSTPELPLLSFDKILEVRYVGKKESYKYQRARRASSQIGYDRPLTSFLTLLKPSVSVQSDGQFFSSKDIYCQGYWTWELMANALPLDYYPDSPTAIIDY
ncbi:carboxypeptidase-like regulatory domain-containing protein [uncultured Imperialibacter sp.]|uniref:carboxypeptidase-like regulatory domain-containing protein n=1 Tax=uncultured Imperialibacter sp. TaxID=1672639 RepID=UPI0030D83514|tara:strand:+ start:8102 stop:9286 length:1185 start_codon:yes stop_codon:yes gene_type:complete